MTNILLFTPTPVSLFILFVLLNGANGAVRNKEIDETYKKLIPLENFMKPCTKRHGETAEEYGLINGELEKCKVYYDAQEGIHEEFSYEKYKCKHLRVHGLVDTDGKCQCENNWKGPICNEYHGCPDGYSLFNGVCTPNPCQHDGVLALGSNRIECICNAPWDGHFCERLACWRMAEKHHERRWRNSHDKCICAEGYTGEKCNEIVFCKNGDLMRGRCECHEGWKGEICDRKCHPNQTCGATPVAISLLLLLITSITASAYSYWKT